MPQSVGWQFIGHIVRTILGGSSVTVDAMVRVNRIKRRDPFYQHDFIASRRGDFDQINH